MFRVLLVDDEELALISLQYAFPWQEFGFTDIITTTDSEEALKILKERRVDAAFVDIRMPAVNGLELVKLAQERGLDTIFVIVSGYSDFTYAKKAISYGVLDYCLKPVAAEEAPPLLDKLRGRILSMRYTQDPRYTLRLLSDEAGCRAMLRSIMPDNESKHNLTLLHIYSPDMMNLISQTNDFPPDEFLFWGDNDVMLIWGSSPEDDQLEGFLNKYQSSALLIHDMAQPDPAAFQNALKRIRMERESSENGRTGIVRFSPISAEMKNCFNGLLSYVEENYSQNLTLQSLAHRFGINYTYLSQQFNKAIGKPFSEYLTCIRLQAACRLLTETQLRIVTIAENVGYSDYHYFSNVFKRQYAMTPLQYRKATRKEPEV